MMPGCLFASFKNLATYPIDKYPTLGYNAYIGQDKHADTHKEMNMNSQDTAKVNVTVTTQDGQQYTEERTISSEVLEDAFALMNWQRSQIEADPNIVKTEIWTKVTK